jgi:ribose transport system permease protein
MSSAEFHSPPWWLRIFRSAGPLLGIGLVLTLFTLSPEARESLFTGGNAKLVLAQTVIVALGAVGMTLVIVSGGIDLSVGATVAFCSVVGAKLLVAGWSSWTAALAVVATGAALGGVTGSLVAGLRFSPFIVTLGMMGIVRGAAKWLSDKQAVYNPGDAPLNHLMERVAPQHFLPLPTGVWITVGLVAVMSFVMRRSIFGRHVYAIGSNEAAARLCGVRVRLTKLWIYLLAGAFFGLAGLMQQSRLTQGDPTVAVGLELDVIAAVVIGGASLNGGIGGVMGSLLGALLMAILRNGTNQLGWDTYVQEIIIGAVIVLAVGLDKWRQSRAGA